jgi:hypothetical protein
MFGIGATAQFEWGRSEAKELRKECGATMKEENESRLEVKSATVVERKLWFKLVII